MGYDTIEINIVIDDKGKFNQVYIYHPPLNYWCVQYVQYLSYHWPDYDQFLKVGIWEHFICSGGEIQAKILLWEKYLRPNF